MQPLFGCYSFKPQPEISSGLLEDFQHQIISGDRFALRYAPRFARVVSADRSSCIIQVSVAGDGITWDAEVEISPEGLSLSRDLFGRMPLYWLSSANAIWFSTHLQALLKFTDSTLVSAQAFHAYASFSFVPVPLSPLPGINALEPGCSTRWLSGDKKPELSRHSSWPIYQNLNSSLSEQQAIEELSHELNAAALAQMKDIGDKPVAVFLSGGLDSAITAACLARAGLKVSAYSLDFGPHGLSELPFAQAVAQHLGIRLKAVRALPQDIKRGLIPTVKALDNVFGDGVSVPLWLLNKAAADDGHTIAFNGEGGDQLFGGWTNKPLIASSVYGLENNDEDRLLATYMRTFHRLHGHEHLVFSAELRKQIAQSDLHRYLTEALSHADKVPLISVLRRANLILKGAQNIQPRASNLAISHGLNLRSLFCHKPLAEWTFRLQPELILRGACEKYILKRAVESWLPESIIYREKRGMGVPLTEWCAGPLWGLLGKYLNSRQLSRRGYWQPDIACRLVVGDVSAQLSGRRIGEILWLMLMWEAWNNHVREAEKPLCRYNAFWPPVPLLRFLKKEVYRV